MSGRDWQNYMWDFGQKYKVFSISFKHIFLVEYFKVQDITNFQCFIALCWFVLSVNHNVSPCCQGRRKVWISDTIRLLPFIKIYVIKRLFYVSDQISVYKNDLCFDMHLNLVARYQLSKCIPCSSTSHQPIPKSAAWLNHQNFRVQLISEPNTAV